MVWSLCRMTSWICRSTVTLVSSSSCFCVLASATHVRYVAMASSACGGAQRAPGEAPAWGSGPTRTPGQQEARPRPSPPGPALTLFLASSSRRRRLSRALEAVPPAPGPVPA